MHRDEDVVASSPQASAAAHEPEESRNPRQSQPPTSPASVPGTQVPRSGPTDRTNTDALWSQCRQILRETVSEALWLGYFRHLQALHIDDALAVLIAPSNMIRDRIQRRYIPMLHAAFEQLPVRPQNYEIETRPDIGDLDQANVTNADVQDYALPRPAAEQEPEAEIAPPPARTPARPQIPHADATNPRYTFGSFVTGSSNRFAQAAALAVAETPGVAYNPLFIHGSTGLGKTHLLQAIVNYLGETLPEHRVSYVSTETFLSEFIEAIRMNTTPAFKRRYRDLDVLLLDDIQFMEGKEGLQEELFHTFNSLHVAGRQIVISSDRPPRSIATLSDRLRSRFEWGLITDIQPPDLETRVAILRKKTEHRHVPDEVLKYIAHLITNNIRELEGALVRVTAFASLTRSQVALEMAQQILSDVREPQEEPITTDRILQMTADVFGYDIAELTSPGRQQGLVKARQISMYVMRELTDLSYPAIASVFGGRDHTTVMHAVKKINRLLPSERKVYDQVAQLIARVRAV
ncbi:chromosomal replication initiator protein DnaA [Candidatus Poriferisodalis sp.]|uniref:chromosomal replication initiator protein DnaA n=1 Tax=Candidatus Poriferisodalis sp. TaxID=3101277 RepID=UPI003D142E26